MCHGMLGKYVAVRSLKSQICKGEGKMTVSVRRVGSLFFSAGNWPCKLTQLTTLPAYQLTGSAAAKLFGNKDSGQRLSRLVALRNQSRNSPVEPTSLHQIMEPSFFGGLCDTQKHIETLNKKCFMFTLFNFFWELRHSYSHPGILFAVPLAGLRGD